MGGKRIEPGDNLLSRKAPEGGYTARAIGYSIFTEGEALDEIRSNVREAVRCHFEDNEMLRVMRLHIVKDEGNCSILANGRAE